MSRLNDLIEKLCPDGVEYRALSELGYFYGGLTGKTKSDFSNGNCFMLPYTNIFNNISVNVKSVVTVNVEENEKQNEVEYGDTIFTGSSEIREKSGMSSVMTTIHEKPLYLNSFCFGFRFNEKNIMIPDFSKYLFRSSDIRNKIIKTSNGVTRFNISKKKMLKLKIPIPPLPVQEEIVRILDNFTELTARKKQYEYYRDSLLTFGDEVGLKAISDIGTLIRGNGLKKDEFTDVGFGCIHYGQIYTYYGVFTSSTKSFVSDELASKLKKVSKNDLIIACTSENIEDVCKSVAWLGEDDIVTGGHATILKHNENPKYLAYYTQTSMFDIEKSKYAQGTKVIDISGKSLAKFLIPIPPLSEQERIVAILDKFDALVNDITQGLPAEIETRQKQYEYYRDKLLTFKEQI